MFKTTAEDCCREFFKNPDCPVTDVCGGGGPAPSGNSNPGPSPASGSSSSSASSCKWHIAQRSADGCSNDNDVSKRIISRGGIETIILSIGNVL